MRVTLMMRCREAVWNGLYVIRFPCVWMQCVAITFSTVNVACGRCASLFAMSVSSATDRATTGLIEGTTFGPNENAVNS